MSERNPTLGQIINQALEHKMAGLYVAQPGKVLRFDATNQLADVQPLLSEITFDESGAEQATAQPTIYNVPVIFPGGGQFAQTWPVSAEDPCLLVFSDRSLDLWIENGGSLNPLLLHTHQLSDAVAILGLRSKPGRLTEFDSTRAVWGAVGSGKIRIAATGDEIHLGVTHSQAASQASVRGDAYLDSEADFFSALVDKLTSAGVALTAAATSLTTAAGQNATPVYGGAMASPAFTAAAQSISSAAQSLSQIAAALATFTSSSSNHKTRKALLP
jgi:hypothetical protein